MDRIIPQHHRSAGQPTVHTPTSTPPAIDALDVSFGVEFEFILIEHFPDWKEWQATGHKDKVFYGLSQVGEVLKNTWFKCSSCDDHFRMPIGVQPANESWSPDHSGWNVVADDSMQLTERQKALLKENHFDMMGIQVTSRKLFADREQPVPSNDATTDHQHTISTADEIDTVLGALKQAFNSPAAAAAAQNGLRTPRWLAVNKTCDLHVHVGNNTKPFPLQTVKHLVSLCTAFERVIDGMHPYTRTGGTGLALATLDVLDKEPEIRVGADALEKYAITAHKPYNVAFAEHFIARAWCERRNASDHPSPASTPSKPVYPFDKISSSNPVLAGAVTGLHAAAFLELIAGASTIDELGENLVFGKEMTVSLMYLLKGWETFAKTIEFRQHAAVTTPAETLPWIDFAGALVRYAHTSSAEDVHAACTHAINAPDLSLMDLLVLLPMKQEHLHYYLDRADGREPSYDDATARAEVQAAFGNTGCPLRTIALEVIDGEKEGYDIAAVRKGVKNKFDGGGYGHFSRRFIDVYAPDLEDEEKEKLTIGWEAPVRGSEEEDVLPPFPAIEGVEDIEILQE
jgi:hypothetical protein